MKKRQPIPFETPYQHVLDIKIAQFLRDHGVSAHWDERIRNFMLKMTESQDPVNQPGCRARLLSVDKLFPLSGSVVMQRESDGKKFALTLVTTGRAKRFGQWPPHKWEGKEVA